MKCEGLCLNRYRNDPLRQPTDVRDNIDSLRYRRCTYSASNCVLQPTRPVDRVLFDDNVDGRNYWMALSLNN